MDNESIFTGALLDTRSDEERARDFNLVEIVASAAPVNWVKKTHDEFRSFAKRFQKNSGSCVAQTMAKILGVMLWLRQGGFVVFSANSIYRSRSNKPSGGMIGVEAFEIARKEGVSLEAIYPSQSKSDSEMDAVPTDALDDQLEEVFRISNHIGIRNGDFDTVASVIQETGKAVMVWFWFKGDEWWGQEVPRAYRTDINVSTADRHSVAAVDFGILDGVEVIKIEDSSRSADDRDRNRKESDGVDVQVRYITRDFFEKRNFFARYPMSFKYEEGVNPIPDQPGKPTWTFTRPLEFIPLDERGNISDLAKNEAQKVDVASLQNILKYEGLFPANVASTGYYGAITAKAVYNWQVKHDVAPLDELNSIVPKGGRVGNKTIAKLKELYE